VLFILLKKLTTFGYVVGRFSANGNLSLFCEFFNWSTNEIKPIFVVRTIAIGKGDGGVAQERGGWE
jgi:hypothetical protein